ncbi:MAG: protein kinase [Calditrichaeota bacterium]|nr:protein kinase [Calditrichota bacterium]
MIGQIVAQYKIIAKIGEGGMSEVYKARDIKLKREVALKFLTAELRHLPEARELFIREARAASSLDHTNICTIFEISKTKPQLKTSKDSLLYISMAYYRGKTLRKILSESGKTGIIHRKSLGINRVIDIARQIADGLAFAHTNGIIHRDIKPENIMITSDGVVKILDFGLAKMRSVLQNNEFAKRVGTVLYMSPEQILGEEVDQRTDIWSYGIVLYEMLTGEPPFKGEFRQDIFWSILNESVDLEKLKQLNVPDFLVDILQKALQKDVNKRFGSIEEILNYFSNNEALFLPSKKFEVSSLVKNKLFRRSAILIFILLLLTLFYRLYYSSSHLSSELYEGYVLIGEFENQTGEEVFQNTLTEALRISLRQSLNIKLLPSYRINNALKRMKYSANQELTQPVAIEIAQRENVPLVINGKISKLGSKYVLAANIIESQSGETVEILRVECRKIEDVLKGMDKLVGKIRNSLGETLQLINRNSIPLEKETTKSLEALKWYTKGIRLEAQGKYEESIALKEKALSIDSTFVMAISSLSYSYKKVGNYKKAYYYHKKILPLINQVSDREQFQILILYYGPAFEEDYDLAAYYAKQYLILYPQDALAYAFLGHLSMFTGDYKTSIRSSLKAVELDSFLAGACLDNAGYAYALAGNADSALYYFKQSKNLRPNYLAIDGYMAQAFWIKDEPDSAWSYFSYVARHAKGIQKIRTHAQLASLYYFQGKLRQALEECDNGISESKLQKRKEDEAYFHYLKGEISLVAGLGDEYFKEMEQAVNLSDDPFIEYFLAAASFAREGLSEKAELLLHKLDSLQSYSPYFKNNKISFTNYIRGELAMSENRFNDAIEFYKQVKTNSVVNPIYLLAQKKIILSLANLNDRNFRQKYSELLEKKGEIFMASLPSIRKGGLWTARLWSELYYDLGMVYASKKDTLEAIKNLSRALNYWKEADDEFFKAKKANKMLAQLIYVE